MTINTKYKIIVLNYQYENQKDLKILKFVINN